MNNIKPYQYPFSFNYNVILGCPRSGTTFLLDSLESLENTECISGHILPLVIPQLVNQNISEEVYQTLVNTFEFSLQDYLTTLDKARFRYLQKWLSKSLTTRELITALQRKRVIKNIIYKEPFLSFAPEYTYHALPDCRIIHIYRDGRDCADSLIRKYKVLGDDKLVTLKTSEMPIGRKYDHRYVPWWVETGLESDFIAATPYVRAIWMWKEMVRRCHEFFSKPEVIQSGRVMLLRYEDLVSNPQQWAEAVVKHFDGTINPRLIQKFNQAKVNSIGIHKNRSKEEIEAATSIAKYELELYGYL